MESFVIETLENIWVDELICLRNKMCAFKWEYDKKNRLKDIFTSQSKKIMFEEFKKF